MIDRFVVLISLLLNNNLKSWYADNLPLYKSIKTSSLTIILLSYLPSFSFVIDKSLGDNGDFPYPNENYIAHVIGILNAITIETATHIDKKVMLSLRENPIQTRIENNKGCESIISYNLVYENISELNYNLKDNTLWVINLVFHIV